MTGEGLCKIEKQARQHIAYALYDHDVLKLCKEVRKLICENARLRQQCKAVRCDD